MVMLKAKDTSTSQRQTVWVIITFTGAYSTRRMYQNIHYRMNVMLQHTKNTVSRLNASCCLFCFCFIKVLLQKSTLLANRHQVCYSFFLSYPHIHLDLRSCERRMLQPLTLPTKCARIKPAAVATATFKHCVNHQSSQYQTDNYFDSSFISNKKDRPIVLIDQCILYTHCMDPIQLTTTAA